MSTRKIVVFTMSARPSPAAVLGAAGLGLLADACPELARSRVDAELPRAEDEAARGDAL